MAFDKDALDAMMQDDVRKPIETRGIANIYQHFHVGSRYAAGADVAHGTQNDESVLVVVDVKSGYVVADIHSSVVAPEDFAYECVSLLERYKNPIFGIEDNEWGKVVIDAVKRLNYPRVYEHHKDRPGWHTDARTRPLMWNGLMEAIKDRLIVIPSLHGLAQFMGVIRNPKKDRRVEAQEGDHDDYPTAAAIARQMREHAPTTRRVIPVIRAGEKRGVAV